ncbi:FG-GAP-like repeat-containing protein, partial [Candidatus Binatia bacterium]|nr:FG-GAP-like repeat-containing protein [Candidatus Binatia bacterium]
GCKQSDAPGWCVARRFAGDVAGGELGFRFGEPRDVDGDGVADVVAGARFTLEKGTLQNGSATVWSGATGAPLRIWRGELPDGLFGHWVLLLPDLDGDGSADVAISAPNARVEGSVRGVVSARSPATGKEIWQRSGKDTENLGWDLAPAGDQNGDGVADLFAGAPSVDAGSVKLLSGKDGTVLRTYTPPSDVQSFGWYVAAVGDLDGDGRADLAAGAPLEPGVAEAKMGGAWVLSTRDGRVLQHWQGTTKLDGFGEIVAAVGDLDGDGVGDIAVSSPRTNDQTRSLPGEVFVYSGKTGNALRHWTGTQPGELYGRMVTSTGDLDRDGVDDVAIGAPWYRDGERARVGRLELRSGRTGAVIDQLVGDEADGWFGWHVRRAPDPDGGKRPALLVGSLRHSVDGEPAVGVIDLYVLRAAPPSGGAGKGKHRSHGTTTRGARRSDIR